MSEEITQLSVGCMEGSMREIDVLDVAVRDPRAEGYGVCVETGIAGVDECV